ncbi:MAG: MBL fold metallo-hydrolase [Acidobacteria bacterium]|nr:MBL fold metallo-hydrolase [Acidobacteriota bacterium]
MQRLTLGNFELLAVSDGIHRLDGGAYFGVVPKVLWEKKLPANDKNQVPSGLNSVVVRTGDHTVLIETGIGNKLPEKIAQIFGQPAQLLESLSAAGIAPEDIDIVINSHLHFDHAGWNTVLKNGYPVATFPKATYYVQEGEWKHAHEGQRDSPSYYSENYDPLVESGQMKLLRGDTQIVPGISVRVYPGHTRAMQGILVESAGQTACYIGDLIPTSAHLDLSWVMGFDLYPVETMESRQRYYAESLAGNWLTMFTHDPEIPWAYVEKNEKGKMVARPPA